MTDKADEPSILLDSPRFDSPTNNMLVANGVPFSIYQGLPFSYRYQLHNEYSGQQYSGRSDRGFISRTFTLPIGGGHFGCRTIDDHDNYSKWSFVWFSVVERPVLMGHSFEPGDNNYFFGTRSHDQAAILEFELAGQKQIVPISLGAPDHFLVKVNFEIPAGTHDAVVRYTNVKYSNTTYRFTVPARSAITSPIEDELVTHSQLVFKGTCSPGATITVVEARDHYATLSEAQLFNSPTWELALKTGKFLPSGNLAIQTQHLFPGQSHGYSEEVKLNVLGFPVISSPGPLQETQFNLQGNNGMIGAQVEVFQDLSEDLLGSSSLLTSDKWEVALKDLKPGPLSLVAEQSFKGVRSGRGAPRDFRIRPPKLEKPEVTFLPHTSLKFSGTGHFDQNLSTEIQFSARDGSLPLPPNIRVDGLGHWETAPVVWPLGSYDVTVIQKIADNASDWIESQPLEFIVHHDMPDITEASYTEEYLPVFSGEGYTGATVSLRDPDAHEVARSVGVVNGQWSTPALVEWGPTNKREVRITQHLGDHPSQRPFILYVTIPPLAPGLDDPAEEGVEPIFSGACWSEALVKLRFSDDDMEYEADVEDERWTFQRAKTFEPGVLHRVSVTQIVVDLPSALTSKTFTVHRVMLQPLIVAPASGTEVGDDVTIEGDNGMQGAMMQLHDSQMGGTLGAPIELLEEGKWSIELRDLELRHYFLHAQQTLNGRESTNSAEHELRVVPQPRFTTPIPGGKAPRTSKIAGTGIPGAWVEVWLQGATEPLLTAIEVNASDNWEAEVSLPVGNTTIWAFQTFVHNGVPQRSQPNERLRYKVVPAAPFIETPTADDHVGRRVVVSGFATPGDTVTVTLGSDQASAEVRENRTWSVTLEPGQDEGNHELEVVAAYEGFASDSAKRTVQLATYMPTVEIPAPGRWVSNPVLFAGKGRQGVGVLVDPFNPDKTWVASIQVDPDWQCLSDQALPLGGNWCRFKLQPSDSDPVGSDWVVSERFEIESAPADKPRL
ncbi:hypothetical protein [Pseudomonas fluorescens]|uniref:Bacterial Ig-like domain-containing protein n=1 Tax=Pseudomonas fluorescens TaxID=294 RepID=A0A5E7TX11_PSEFL|nr:hypothetical protein [Pseudomonas fluorescens]VVQ02695.1 hypothetical protein PS941_02742 [Pseudomonas fluorescens]